MRLGSLLLAAALLAGCSDGDPDATPSTPAVVLTLPAGTLSALPVQPNEVPAGLVPILSQTGPADLAKIASFSADPATASQALRDHGFVDAYVATYGDPDSGRIITSVVARFATVAGATADLTGDLESAKETGTPFDVSGLGDQAGGVRGKLDPKAGTGELITIRWRIAETTYLVAVGAPNDVDDEAVVTLARQVATHRRT